MSYSALLGGNPLMYMGRAGAGGLRFGPPENFNAGDKLPAGLWIVQSTTNVGTVDVEGTGWPINGALVASNGDVELTAPVAAVRVTGLMQGPTGAAGPPGAAGANGAPGAPGAAASITGVTVNTGAAGTNASVTMGGTAQARSFDFTIPRGNDGAPGATTGASWGSITGTLSAQTDLNTALTGKQATLVSGTTIKTVNGTTLLGAGDLAVAGGGGGTVTSITATAPLSGGTITGSGSIGLNNSGVAAGTYQGLTVDTFGRVTAASNMGYTASAGTVTSVGTGTGLTGGPITGAGTLALANSGVTAGTYQGITFDVHGRATGASNQNYATGAALTALEARVLALESAGPPPAQAPVVSSSATASATESESFSYTITASNTPTSFNATGLPGWLTRTGAVISGTPPVGSHATGATFTVTATNAHGTSPGVLVTVTIAQASAGWSMTYTFPTPPTGFDFTGGGKIPLANWTGWNAGTMQADFTDANLYGPPAPANMAALPVHMYATFTPPGTEVLVDFDLWPGTPAGNKITMWGFDSTDNTVYIEGSNGSGNPIQLRLVRA